MSEEKETVKEVKKHDKSENVTLSKGDLAEIIATAIASASQHQSESNRALAEAIIESRKPYKDPNVAANEEAARQSMRESNERMRQQIKANQRGCSHLRNAGGTRPDTLTAIAKHQLDHGEIIGICTECIRVFKPGDGDYTFWMRKASGHEMSRAGQRQFADPTAVAVRGRAALATEDYSTEQVPQQF
jgi:hypothetical protein